MKFVFGGIDNNKVRKHLLREASLTLVKTNEIVHVVESNVGRSKIYVLLSAWKSCAHTRKKHGYVLDRSYESIPLV